MNKKNIAKKKKVYLIGICGSGMSALAVLFKEAGWQVTGSDEGSFEPTLSYLKRNEIFFHKKYNAKNVRKDIDLVVIGNNAPLSAEENVETRHAVKLGLEIQSMPQALAMLSRNKERVVVVGSSGKSSMTALISWCLVQAKKDPSYFIGAMPLDLKNSSHLGKGRNFILEGDEYTSSKTDRRSKFLHLDPKSVLLISGQHDHVNIFPTETLYKTTYKKLMAKIPKNGLLVYALLGKNNKEIVKHAKCKTVSYGLSKKADWHAENIKYGMQSSFDLMRKNKKIVQIKTTLLGKHNIENIVGAGAILLEQKKVPPKTFIRAIKRFHGVKNRIEAKNKNEGVLIYQGFGSSYEKTRAIFETMKLHFPNRRLVAIFEPHSFSWRNKKFLKWYRDIFDGVDEVLMLPATGHGKKAKNQLTNSEVWQEVKKYRQDTHFIKSEKKGLAIAKKIIKKGDVIVLVSSGPMLGLTESIPKLVEKYF